MVQKAFTEADSGIASGRPITLPRLNCPNAERVIRSSMLSVVSKISAQPHHIGCC